MNSFARYLIVGSAVLSIMGMGALAGHTWSTYHWARETNPVTLELIDNVTLDWEGILDSVSADWNASTVVETLVVAGSESKKDRRQCRAVNGKIKVCNLTYGGTGWLGIARIWLDSTGHIEKGVAQLNDSYAIMQDPNARRHVACQEVGHLLGLNHGYDEDSCMDDTYNLLTDPNFISPGAHDFYQLESIYEHADAPPPVEDPPTKPGRGGRKPKKFGKNTTVENLPNGRKLITHIFPAP